MTKQNPPAPADVRAARISAGMTQSTAAGLVHANLRAWQMWEAGDRRMHPAMWELWQIKSARPTNSLQPD